MHDMDITLLFEERSLIIFWLFLGLLNGIPINLWLMTTHFIIEIMVTGK